MELNELCWAKATADIMLDSALQDCEAALKLRPSEGRMLDSLGMVLLKLGRLDEALAAYNQAIAKRTGAASLMGRAFVYLRKGDRTRAEADAAAARKLVGDIEDTFSGYDLKFDQRSAGATTAAQ
jgi:tetratricopeptide (TPR) repeat protein